MKLLIFGGTQFVGRHIAETALAHGHEVSLFHRGQTGPGLHPQAEHILGDRKGELSVIGDRRFDAVIDVSGYLPQVVNKSVEFTRNLTNHYLFISTISVYDAEGMSQVDEATPLLVPPAEEVDVVTNETYGGLKVACEAAVRSAFPGATILRPGLVGGPYDHTKRFDRWIQAAIRDEKIRIPTDPDRAVQLVDGRDLAEFALTATERSLAGTFNITGVPSNWGELAAALRALAPSGNVEFGPSTDENPPMVIPLDSSDALFRTSHQRAVEQGFQPRTIQEMVADAPNWPQNQISP